MKTRIVRLAATLLLIGALGATAASAASAHEWTIKGESLTKLGLKSESLAFKTPSNFQFTTSLASQTLKWRCAPTFSEGSITPEGKGRIQIGLSSCQFETGGIEPACHLTPLANPVLRTELVEAAGVLYLKFLPSMGEAALFSWTFGGSDCFSHSSWYFQGSFAAKISSAKTSAVEHTLEISPANTTAAGAKLHFGPENAELLASYSNSLAGPNLGKTWAAE